MYDPTIGRWISEDPIEFAGGDTNLYRYVNNGPTYRTDPSGLLNVSLSDIGSTFFSIPGNPLNLLQQNPVRYYETGDYRYLVPGGQYVIGAIDDGAQALGQALAGDFATPTATLQRYNDQIAWYIPAPVPDIGRLIPAVANGNFGDAVPYLLDGRIGQLWDRTWQNAGQGDSWYTALGSAFSERAPLASSVLAAFELGHEVTIDGRPLNPADVRGRLMHIYSDVASVTGMVAAYGSLPNINRPPVPGQPRFIGPLTPAQLLASGQRVSLPVIEAPTLRPVAPRTRPTIHAGRQGKHVPGHNNFNPAAGRSELTHPNPQALLDGGAGTGSPLPGPPTGTPGFREVVVFGEVIGIYFRLSVKSAD
ncbi:MAG: hypothetical protein HYX68_22345 [Planctomycetes bacterium]|nr:hypothetical protein [Planctomycetota bacterium]